jgi:hypothetical protein
MQILYLLLARPFSIPNEKNPLYLFKKASSITSLDCGTSKSKGLRKPLPITS